MEGNDDQIVIVYTSRIDWQPSPSPKVWRKRLELYGPSEAGRVTSVVRFEPNSRFATHDHPRGEEILVLDGTFSDEHGDYSRGSFLLNPEGFTHAPFSNGGCQLFVKLRQYPGPSRTKLQLHTDDLVWYPAAQDGVSMATLYGEPDYPERIRMACLQSGTSLRLGNAHGLELFVLNGDLKHGCNRLTQGTWCRLQPGIPACFHSSGGARCYIKSGHLSGA